jgi:hypothetical protein
MSGDDDRLVRARAVRVLEELERRGVKLRRSGGEFIGPCPVCGGDDRFAVNARKNLFHCRKSGAGGDAIALVTYLDGCDFLAAVELLTGEGRPASTARLADRGPGLRRDDDNQYRKREIARAREIWDGAGDRAVAEAYLAWRGITLPRGAKVRGASALAYYHEPADSAGGRGRAERIYEGPAMVAAIAGNDGAFLGVHLTWIDPRILIAGWAGPSSGKAEIAAPDTGEICDAKKMRGSARAGHIHLGGPAAPARLVIGEGIETTGSVLMAMLEDEGEALLEACAFWAGLSLGNIGGRALASVRHPALKRIDKLGRARAQQVPGPYPLMEDSRPALMPPASAMDVLTLADGDSDRFTAAMHHARAGARWAAPGRTVRTAWAPEGQDFNDLWRAREAAA